MASSSPSLSGAMTKSGLGPRIILIDDDETFGKVMLAFAAREHLSLTFVRSVRDIYNLNHWDYDIALVDYNLGKVNGLQLTNYLEHYLHPKLVFLISANKEIPQDLWPPSVKGFVSKADGVISILDTAAEGLRRQTFRFLTRALTFPANFR